MKAIYLTDNKEKWSAVYSLNIKNKIAELVDIEDKCYTSNDIQTTDFSDVVFIFSTWGMPVLSDTIIQENFKELKAVFYSAGSVQPFARQLINNGVRVFSAWKANAVPVIEYCYSQIILAGKGFYQVSFKTKSNYKEASELFNNYKGNYNINVGFIGYGTISSGIISRLKRDCNYNIFVYDKFLTNEKAREIGIEKKSLNYIFENCDIISNHLANKPELRNIINGELLSSLKPFSTFINTGRGAQVDEQALISVLENDNSITAVLDVTFPEPPSAGSKLYSLPNVFLTPHIAGSAGYEVMRMSEYMYNDFKRYLNNEKVEYEVTADMLERMA